MIYKKEDSFDGEKVLVLSKKSIKSLKRHVIAKNAYLTDIGYFPKALYHYKERENGSEEYILIFCIEGSGWIETCGRRSYLHKNQYYIIPKNTPHKYASNDTGPWSIYWVHFGGDKIRQLISFTDRTCSLNLNSNVHTKKLTLLFEEIFSLLDDNISLNNLEYSSILLINLLGFLKYHSLNKNVNPINLNDPIPKAITYMKDHLLDKVTVQNLAFHCNLSVSHFCLLFKKQTDHTPIEYLTLLRIQKACNMLDFTSLRINEVARSVGYEDSYYFTRVFKNVMGKSPSSYRNT